MPILLGKKSPDFSLPCTDGTVFKLHERQKGKFTVLYFYPKDFTSGCTTESCSFADYWEQLQELSCDVYGISADSLSTHREFKKKHHLPFELLSDAGHVVCKLYDAKMPLIPMVKRVTYLIGPDLLVVGKYENLLLAAQHVQQMMQLLEKKKT